jgi:hypothetical protein
VKYDTPILVSKAFNKSKQPANNNSHINSQKTSASSSRSKDDPASKAEDYLNSILPPREY